MAAGTAAAGVGASVYGANKQSKAIKQQNEMNAQLAREAQEYNYRMWLESQGVGADGRPVNTITPRWMKMRTGGAPARPRRLVPKGTAKPMVRQGARLAPTASSATPVAGAPALDQMGYPTDYYR